MQRTRSTGTLLGLVALGLLASTMSLPDSAQAQTTSNGPYYATPSWDQTLPAASRFIILSNFSSAAVLDRETGLVWERSPATNVAAWFNSRFACADKTVGGRKGWRLPAIAELASLIDPSVAPPGPTLPPGHPFVGIQSALYWSATSFTDSPVFAWTMNFANGNLFFDLREDGNQVWCVRGGMNADQY